MKKIMVLVGILICAFGLKAQTPVSFPLQSMFGQPYSGIFSITAKQPCWTDGTNVYFGTRYGTNLFNCGNVVINCQPNNYWVEANGGGFGFTLAPGLGSSPVSVLSLPTTNLSTFTYSISNLKYVTTNGATALGQVPTWTTNGYQWIVIPFPTNTVTNGGAALAAGPGITITPNNGTNVVSVTPGTYDAYGAAAAAQAASDPVGTATAAARAATNTLAAAALAGNVPALCLGNIAAGANVTVTTSGGQVVIGATGGGSGGGALWTASGSTIFPNGNTGTNNGWISTGPTLYPQ